MINKLITWANDNNVNFERTEVNGTTFVYFHGQEIKTERGKYIPYLRVSYHPEEESYYVRDNGWCHYIMEKELKELILRDYK